MLASARYKVGQKIKVRSGSFGVGYDNYSPFYKIVKVLKGSYGVRTGVIWGENKM